MANCSSRQIIFDGSFHGYSLSICVDFNPKTIKGVKDYGGIVKIILSKDMGSQLCSGIFELEMLGFERFVDMRNRHDQNATRIH